MSDRPRRFWQIHLSTAVVLSMATATLLYVSCEPQRVNDSWQGQSVGWPYLLWGAGSSKDLDEQEARYVQNALTSRGFAYDTVVVDDCQVVRLPSGKHIVTFKAHEMSVWKWAINIIIFLVINGVAALLSEYLIRRRFKP